MILLFSNGPTDETINVIIDWLLYYKKKFIRIDNSDQLINLLTQHESVDDFVGSIGAVYSNGVSFNHFAFSNAQDKLQNEISYHLTNDFSKFFDSILSHKFSNPFKREKLNKYHVLLVAQKVGLTIPDSRLVISKKELIDFENKHHKIITKDYGENLTISNSTLFSLNTKTEILTLDNAIVSESFMPTLVQQYIEKEFEIRAFCGFKKIFSVAIFIKKNSSHTVDYRKGLHDKEVKVVPFNLPKPVGNKIKRLLKKLNIEKGSVDLIYANEKYYFLEVNEFGQFGFTSDFGNYYIEKYISEQL